MQIRFIEAENEVCHLNTSLLYSPFQLYQPKIVKPTTIGAKMLMIMIQGMGLLISPWLELLIFLMALIIRRINATGPISIQSIPKILFILFILIIYACSFTLSERYKLPIMKHSDAMPIGYHKPDR